jgi:hypothetical protein
MEATPCCDGVNGSESALGEEYGFHEYLEIKSSPGYSPGSSGV